jgi:DNA-binding transcriptional ArsR family regulator
MPFPSGSNTDVYKALTHPERRKLLQAIAKKPLTPTEIIKVLGIHQSLVSKHLMCLRDSNLVIVGKRGRSTEYSPNTTAIDTLLGEIMKMKPSA